MVVAKDESRSRVTLLMAHDIVISLDICLPDLAPQ